MRPGRWWKGTGSQVAAVCKLLNKIIKTDSYPDEEERRLFYVALTRSKNYTYLLVPKNNPSIFITEIKKYGKEYIEEINL